MPLGSHETMSKRFWIAAVRVRNSSGRASTPELPGPPGLNSSDPMRAAGVRAGLRARASVDRRAGRIGVVARDGQAGALQRPAGLPGEPAGRRGRAGCRTAGGLAAVVVLGAPVVVVGASVVVVGASVVVVGAGVVVVVGCLRRVRCVAVAGAGRAGQEGGGDQQSAQAEAMHSSTVPASPLPRPLRLDVDRHAPSLGACPISPIRRPPNWSASSSPCGGRR